MAATPPDPADRRVQRTRHALHDALLSLLPEYGWDAISVHELCTRANVGRSTFYMHFQNKEGLLASGLNDLSHALQAQLEHADPAMPGALQFVRGLIEHVHDRRKVFRSLIGRRSGHVVQTRFREMVLQLVALEMSRLVAAGWQRDAGVRYVAGALVELLAWWVDAGQACSADELERYFYRLTAPAIAQLEPSAT